MPRRQKPQPAGPRALSGSEEAKRKATVILEALVGMRTTQSAGEELGIALARYYVLETRMLQAMVTALEPRARGRKRTHAMEVAQLTETNRKLEREVLRLQSLYRATQRAVGVKEPRPAAKKATQKSRRPRAESRGERVVRVMRKSAPSSGSVDTTSGVSAS